MKVKMWVGVAVGRRQKAVGTIELQWVAVGRRQKAVGAIEL